MTIVIHNIVRFEQYNPYPDSTRNVGDIIEIDTNDPKKDKVWIDRYITMFERFPNIYRRLEDEQREVKTYN